MHQTFTFRWLRPALLFSLLFFAAAGYGQFIYVKKSGNDLNNGQSWQTAFRSIQQALAVAPAGATILVAKGTYYPDERLGSFSADRNATFELKNGISLYGGFDPDNPDPSKIIDGLEDIRDARSILSGDLLVNDFGISPGKSDNAYHVVVNFGANASTVLDGFNIEGGYADGFGFYALGGGMYNLNSSMTINNCSFSNNYAISGGGAMANVSSAPTLSNCNLSNNTSTNGGAIHNNASSPVLRNSRISGNTAVKGGAISNQAASNGSFINCIFLDNTASEFGGAMENNGSNPVTINSTISRNTAPAGGAIHNTSSNPVFTNVIIWNNPATNLQEVENVSGSAPAITYSIVKGIVGGTGNLDQDPLFVDNGISLTACSPAVDAGSNAAVPVGVLKDINGSNRIINTTVDMGALEFSSATTYTYYRDADNDTYGSNTLSKISFCASAPTGWVASSGDCDDGKAVVNPGMDEICGNQIDDNCDGQIDEDCGGGTGCTVDGTFYRDFDGDGFGNPNDIYENPPCTTELAGYVGNGDDCNDNNFDIKPGATEICGNQIDDDCDGQTDEGCVICVNPGNYYFDADGDGYGSGAIVYVDPTCDIDLTRYSLFGNDCWEGDGSIYPGAEEVCENGVDDDCDGQVDEDCGGGTGCTGDGTFYRDFDGDGFGNPNDIYANPPCVTELAGYVFNGDDCDDRNAAINPDAVEICGNGIDEDCDGQVDENCDPCGVFSNLTTTNISSTSATLNWSASTNPDQWQVQYKSTSKGSKWIDVPNVAPADRSVTITNLSRNQNYQWHIRAKCGKVFTKYSVSIDFKTAQNSNSSAALAVNTQKEQVAQASALVIYPSPASHQFSIRLNLNTAVAAPVAIQLFDMSGKMVLNQNAGLVSGILQKQLTLPSSLSNGLYLVRITADGKVFNRKIIVNK